MNIWDFGMNRWEAVVLLILIILEWLMPKTKYRFFREGFWSDLTLLFLINNGVPFVHSQFPYTFDWLRQLPFTWLEQMSFWPQFVICLLVADFFRTLMHFTMHRVSFLWKIHRIHHSTTQLTVLSGFRTGYGEEICFVLFNLPILHLLRFDFDVINTVFTIFALHGHLLHSNLKLKAPKWLSFIACPHFHHWHHSTTEAIPNGQNFGATFTFWDRIIGKYFSPKEHPTEYGLWKGEKLEGNIVKRFFNPIF